MFSKKEISILRNQIPITTVIGDYLRLPSKMIDGYFRFLCPLCSEFQTSTNSKTNLARCFRCEQNFNPIDITMIVKRCTFKEAVEELQDIKEKLDSQISNRVSSLLDSNKSRL